MAGANFGSSVFLFGLDFAPALFAVAEPAFLLAFFCAAHRAFCAAAMRALPSSLMVRLEVFAATWVVAAEVLAALPFGRPRRLAEVRVSGGPGRADEGCG